MDRPESSDASWIRRALELAARGKGRVEPNPPVGAVVVAEGRMVGEGWHEFFGGPHAEVRAIRDAGDGCRGATLYVTLDPCTGTKKKTPPCCDAVVEAGLKRVVIGARDPTQEPASARLRAAGIEVVSGVLEDECRRMVAPFLKLRLEGRPYVIAKWAMTADGRIATAGGDSKWISSDSSRQLVHRWRNEVNAILVGIGTVLRDDPELTCRIPGGRNPLRVIMDARAALPLESRIVRGIGEAPVIVACLESAPEENCRRLVEAGCRVYRLPGAGGMVDAAELLRRLGEAQVTNLMAEGGGKVLGYLFEHRLVDEVRVFIAPKLVGGDSAPAPLGGQGILCMADAIRLRGAEWTPVGDDMLLTGRVEDASACSAG